MVPSEAVVAVERWEECWGLLAVPSEAAVVVECQKDC